MRMVVDSDDAGSEFRVDGSVMAKLQGP